MSQKNSSFKTRARTIDHLGREQIADAPTAISELWKNAYDADATEVELHILDGEATVAAIVDNGSGMSPAEFEEKWLTVGTESKIEANNNKDSKRKFNRQKQGQKGIGRLSCAALGSLLLIVSKQKDSNDRRRCAGAVLARTRRPEVLPEWPQLPHVRRSRT